MNPIFALSCRRQSSLLCALSPTVESARQLSPGVESAARAVASRRIRAPYSCTFIASDRLTRRMRQR